MTTTKLLTTAWDFDPSVCVGCVVMIAVFFWKVKAATPHRVSFVLGILVLFIALESPIDVLGDNYLFCAHMAQHLLLILIVPPLLILGIPEETARIWLRSPRIARLEGVLGKPIVAWCLGMGVMTVWHVPILYNVALAHEVVHVFQHLSFLVTATMFWWPVMHPVPTRRLSIGPAIFYLFAAVAENSVLGIIITFMRVGHYPAYLYPVDVNPGTLGLIRNEGGISAAYDQRLGGLLMWIPGCSVYFVAMLAMMAHWYAEPETEEDAGAASAFAELESEVRHE
ncbi:MAG: cytochrome c oxidase assembly protein [Terracidiphilus sp.]